MTVEVSNDLDYFRSVMLRPGILRAIRAGLDAPMDVEAALRQPCNLFYLVREGEDRRGFIVFQRCGKTALIHTCLLTLGSRTLAAMRGAIQDMGARGFRKIVAVFPRTYRAATRAVERLGFCDEAVPVGAPDNFRVMTLNLS
jgi:hypothetical protein